MKQSPTVSRAVWLLLAGSIILLAGVLAVRHFRPVQGDQSAEVLTALRAERDTLPAADPSQLAFWRERQSALAAERWTEPARLALQEQIGARWRWTELANSGAVRSYQLSATEPSSLPWSEIIATLGRLEGTPGLTVDSLAVMTTGTRSVRSFSSVEIRLTLRWAGAGPGHTAAPVSPSLDRRARVRPTAGGRPEAAAGDRARPASLRSAVHSAARAKQPGGSFPGSARLRGRPDHPRLVRVGGLFLRRDQPKSIP